MNKVQGFLKGKKTYLVALAAIVGVAIAWSQQDISNMDAIKAVVEAILACTIRAGIAKAEV